MAFLTSNLNVSHVYQRWRMIHVCFILSFHESFAYLDSNITRFRRLLLKQLGISLVGRFGKSRKNFKINIFRSHTLSKLRLPIKKCLKSIMACFKQFVYCSVTTNFSEYIPLETMVNLWKSQTKVSKVTTGSI